MMWHEALIESMRDSKRAGYGFEAASKMALLRHPPRGSIEKEIVDDVMRFADDAWHNRRPALRGFSLEMLREGDGARSAAHPGQHRALDAAVAA